MTSSLTRVAIIIPVHNRKTTTLQGLRSLSRIDSAGIDVSIFIVDDGSTDGTADEIARQFPDVAVIRGDGTLHYAAGTNRGILAALDWRPDFVLIANDDSVFHELFLQRMIKTALENPRSIVGALLLLWNEPHRVFQVGQVWKTLAGGWVVPENLTAFNVPQHAFKVECIVGNCALIPVKAILENGLLDEKKFPHGWGDAQYFTRLRKAGWNLLVEPKCYVWCEPNTYPTPLHRLSAGEVVNVLFRNRRHPLNLQRQFVARWESAPSKPRAIAGYVIYLFSLISKFVEYFGMRRSSEL